MKEKNPTEGRELLRGDLITLRHEKKISPRKRRIFLARGREERASLPIIFRH